MLNKLAIGSALIAISIVSWSIFKTANAQISIPSLPSVGNVTETVNNAANGTVDKTTSALDSACVSIISKVDGKISDFKSKHAEHLKYYKTQRENLGVLVTRLNDKGVDTTKLRANLVLFDLKMSKFEDDKQDVLDNLLKVKTLKCAKQVSGIGSAVSDAAAALKTVKEDDADLLSFLNNTIQKDVEALRTR